MKATLLAATFILFPFALRAELPRETTPLVLTLDEVIRMASERNTDIALAELDLKTFQSRYREILGAAIGDLKLTGSYTRNIRKQAAFFSGTDPATGLPTGAQKREIGADNGFLAGVEFEQPLYSGGRLMAGLKAGKKSIELGKEGVHGTREEVTLAAKEIYYSYLLAAATVAIQSDNSKLQNDHLSTIRERYRQGLDSDLTVLRQQVEVANADTLLIQARNLKDLAITNLQNLLAMDVDRPLSLQGELLPPKNEVPSYDRIVEISLKNNSQLQSMRIEREMTDALYKVARAERFPELKAFADFQWAAQADDFSPGANERNNSLGAGLKLEYKFFTGGEVHERIAQARIHINQSREREEKLEREVRVELKRQWLDLIEAKERARSQEAAVGQAQKVLESTEVRFKSGHASQLELNDATIALGRSRNVYAQASHDFWVSFATLEKIMGTTMEEMK